MAESDSDFDLDYIPDESSVESEEYYPRIFSMIDIKEEPFEFTPEVKIHCH